MTGHGEAALVERRDFELVVVGAGVAGMSCALAAAPMRVALVSREAPGAGGSTPKAQGGIAAAVGPDDAAVQHARDTLQVAAGLGDVAAAAVLTDGGPAAIGRLRALGARFDLDAGGKLHRAREAGHAHARVLHAGGDATGREVARVLAAACREAPHITAFAGHAAWDLGLLDGRAAAVLVLDPAGRPLELRAPAVVLATGGYAAAWSRTTNPRGNVGSGLALAARAGAELVDLEFVQFHPTALAVGTDPLPLLTEALRGRGAHLVDGRGRRFLQAVHPDGELAPRDVVAAAIWEQLDGGETVALDLRPIAGDDFSALFPTVDSLCRRHGFDPRRSPLPVTPAAHYCMGGIAVDLDGRSSLPGLWACGEAAGSGVHGANRLASNSLLEGLVFGPRVARAVAVQTQREGNPPAGDRIPWHLPAGARVDAGGPAIDALRALLWEAAGLRRNGRTLEQALERVARQAEAADPADGTLRDLLVVARGVLDWALEREETRGAHCRSDAPTTLPVGRRRRRTLTATAAAASTTPGPVHSARAAR